MDRPFTKRQRQVISDVDARRCRLKTLTESQLISFVNDLRESVFRRNPDHDDIAIGAMAAAKEAISRVLGMDLYDVQLLASDALINRRVAEMQTGEGKTVSAVPAAVYGGVLGGGCHVATPNGYLAERDCDQLRDVYRVLGLQVGLLDAEPNSDKRSAYAADVTYGPGYEFGFDYLRDQMLLKDRDLRPPGQNMLDSLMGNETTVPCQLRGLKYSIIDEADNVLVDDASSPQVLSEFQPGEAPDREAVLLAKQIAEDLQPNVHYRESGRMQVELLDAGADAVHDSSIDIPMQQLIRPWTKYIEAALRAKLHFHRDIQYVIDDESVKIVDESTGRIFEDRSWQSGLHQAIEAAEGLKITPESLPLAQITRQRFYRLYGHLSGMTGTAAPCRQELQSIYSLGITPIPLRVPSRRSVLPLRAFDNADRKWAAITASVAEYHQRKQPVLIGTRTIRESLLLASLLEEQQLPFELLNGCQDADEAEVVSRAGQQGAIMIATNLAGRGTDIKLGSGVQELGGIHVIVSECHSSTRVDRQLVGRCARQGDPGSCQTFVSADDWLFEVYSPWLAESIRSIAANGEVAVNLEPRIRRIQNQIERQEFAARLQLLQSNERQNRILQAV